LVTSTAATEGECAAIIISSSPIGWPVLTIRRVPKQPVFRHFSFLSRVIASLRSEFLSWPPDPGPIRSRPQGTRWRSAVMPQDPNTGACSDVPDRPSAWSCARIQKHLPQSFRSIVLGNWGLLVPANHRRRAAFRRSISRILHGKLPDRAWLVPLCRRHPWRYERKRAAGPARRRQRRGEPGAQGTRANLYSRILQPENISR
jgi:hypothetical protein